jgi:membrane-associated phospholipid phosphatase
VITALMLPAVVYLHAHYLLDVPAGLLAGSLAYAWAKLVWDPVR